MKTKTRTIPARKRTPRKHERQSRALVVPVVETVAIDNPTMRILREMQSEHRQERERNEAKSQIVSDELAAIRRQLDAKYPETMTDYTLLLNPKQAVDVLGGDKKCDDTKIYNNCFMVCGRPHISLEILQSLWPEQIDQKVLAKILAENQARGRTAKRIAAEDDALLLEMNRQASEQTAASAPERPSHQSGQLPEPAPDPDFPRLSRNAAVARRSGSA